MCGIVGIATFQQEPVDRERLNRATASIAHRGPDDDGIYLSRKFNVGLGHRRLAVIDLSPAGHQPMVGARPGLITTYNGEIYNYAELRSELVTAGYRFRSQTDTEVLLHGTDYWGAALLPKLDGIFAYSILDEDAGTLTLVRDRFGIKPLYYHLDHHGIVFASEIKAIIASQYYRPKCLVTALPEYFTFRSIAGERTLFDGILELAPGTFMTISLGNQSVRTTRFHELRVEPRAISEAGAAEDLDAALKTTITSQLRSDVPVGTMNSGGIDSSLISTLVVQQGDSTLRTYCASYGGSANGEYDESRFAQELADRLRTTHRDISTSAAEFFANIASTTWLFDEPLSHPNSIPLFKVYREARKDGVKVMLCGEGADELLGGYDYFSELAFFDTLSRLRPSILASIGAGAVQFLYRKSPWACAAASWNKDNIHAVLDTVAVERRNDLDPGERWGPYRRSFFERPGTDLFSRSCEYVQRTYLPPLLQRTDRMSMASGVESRVPYLSNAISTLANQLPRSLKRRLLPQRVGKLVLRRVASGLLPDAILKRNKYGFAVPLAPWLSSATLSADAQAVLRGLATRERPWADTADTARLLDEHRAGYTDHSRRLWTTLALEVWARCFLDGEMTTSSYTLT